MTEKTGVEAFYEIALIHKDGVADWIAAARNEPRAKYYILLLTLVLERLVEQTNKGGQVPCDGPGCRHVFNTSTGPKLIALALPLNLAKGLGVFSMSLCDDCSQRDNIDSIVATAMGASLGAESVSGPHTLH